MKVLVTGGTGYIGSHTVVELIKSGHEPIVVDNLINSKRSVIDRIEQITDKSVNFYELDVRDTNSLADVLISHPCEAVFHFAGLKAVGESVQKPLLYYKTNIESTTSLIQAVVQTSNEERPPRIVFSSSATVYGKPQFLPFTEDHPSGQNILNPYGYSKYFCEQIIKDVSFSIPNMQAIILRYFNPIGSHPSGLIGEDPLGIPNNLAPYITKVAIGQIPKIKVFGTDYPTKDGSGVRDYIHVCDLAAGHVAALALEDSGVHAFNLGTGKGTSVFELIGAFEKSIGRKLPIELCNRRPGDLPSYWASISNAQLNLSWQPQLSIETACEDMMAWAHSNV